MDDLTILTGGGITVMLGGAEVFFRPLPITQDLDWRKSVGNILANVTKKYHADNSADVLSGMIEYMSCEGMDQVIESCLMLADGSPDMSKVTRIELLNAAVQVVKEIYVPFVGLLLSLQSQLAGGSVKPSR